MLFLLKKTLLNFQKHFKIKIKKLFAVGKKKQIQKLSLYFQNNVGFVKRCTTEKYSL